MVNAKRHGRHRATSRKVTPLASVTEAISRNAHKNMAIAASTGLAVTLLAVPTTYAAPATNDVAKTDLENLKANPVVAVDDSAVWEVDAIAVDRVETKESNEAKATDRNETVAQVTQETPQSATATVASAPAGSIYAEALKFVGTPYVWGGTTPAGFDCSGFVQYVYRQMGISLPRTSGAQGTVGVPVSLAQARPGDIVSWGYHSGIYAGNGMVLHASLPGVPLGLSPMWGGYTIRRVG